MNKINVKIKVLDSRAKLPKYQTPGAAAMDLHAIEETKIWGGTVSKIRTGLAIELPEGFQANIQPRSGLAAKSAITVLNTPGLIDEDFRGELIVILVNHGATYDIKPGERIAQITFTPVYKAEWELVEELSDTQRGTGSLGSTGR